MVEQGEMIDSQSAAQESPAPVESQNAPSEASSTDDGQPVQQQQQAAQENPKAQAEAPAKELSVAEKIAELAAKKAEGADKSKQKEKSAQPDAAATTTTEGQSDFKANTKFLAGVYNKETKEVEQKEYEIDKRFHSLMKDPESEKLVRELHEKAFGLDSIKDRLNETKGYATQLQRENSEIRGGIDGLRKIYQRAVQEQNPHRLDAFFAKLRIPQDVIMHYAIAKAQLNEMDPAQRNEIMGRLQAEQRAETLAEQQEEYTQQQLTQKQELNRLMLDQTMQQPEISALANEWDRRTGRPQAFKQLVINTAQLAYFQENVELTPAQAIQRVIQNYNLTQGGSPSGQAAQPQQAQMQPAAQTPPAAPTKVVVQRTNQTLPNVASKGAHSPIDKKPRSVEDLQKLYKERHASQ